MFFQIVLLIALHFVLPAVYILRLLRQDFPDKTSWLNQVIQGLALAGLVALIGRWDWFSRYLRFLPLLSVTLVAAFRLPAIYAKPTYLPAAHKPWWRQGWRWLETGMVLAAGAVAIFGSRFQTEAAKLSFPLESGTYQVAQGGNTILLNAHQSSEAQALALDIVELNTLGARANGLYPKRLNAYEIFGAKVISPCDGTVLKAQQGLPDLIPPERDRQHLAGNHVVIHCDGVKVLLAHLQRGSIVVNEGDSLREGEAIGRVGNSGNTTEPHLHIHAVEDESGPVLEGKPVPIYFLDRFPVRNDVFVR